MIDFTMGFEYLNDADMRIARAAEAKWRAMVERRQEKQFRRLVDKLIIRSGITRLMSWL